MTFKKLLFLLTAWVLTVAVSAMVAIQYVQAQQLVPPPPVLQINEPSLARLEIKLDAIERRQREQTRYLKAIYVKLFPFKVEQGTMDAPTLDE